MNAFWAALEEHKVIPEKVVVLAHARDKKAVGGVLPSLKTVAKGFDIQVEPEMQVVPEDSLQKGLARIAEVLKEAKKKGEVVLDITPARKSLATVAMRAAQMEGVAKVLYLHLKKVELGAWPYPLIPSTLHECHDLGALKL